MAVVRPSLILYTAAELRAYELLLEEPDPPVVLLEQNYTRHLTPRSAGNLILALAEQIRLERILLAELQLRSAVADPPL